ncbi:MAG: ester cyclase [Chloroflexi bacterium]|nr:ester cyclase [Chloroflexota bacterium]
MNTSRQIRVTAWLLVILAVLGSAVLASAQDSAPAATAQEESHRDLLYRIVEEGVTQGNFEVVSDLLSEAFIVHSPVGDLDREGFMAFMQALRASLSDFKMTREAVIVEGDYAATRAMLTGTFDSADFASPLGVLPPNNQPISVLIQTFHHFDDEGRIVEEWAMFDLMSFFTQLGALPAPSN